MVKKCEIEIEHCNCKCPHFHHKFSDCENIYCDILNKKIFDAQNGDDAMFDFKPRTIPRECPLEDVVISTL